MKYHFHDRRLFFFLFVLGEIGSFTIGFFIDAPFMLYLSGFAFITSLIGLFFNNTLLNSMIIGMIPIFFGFIPGLFISFDVDMVVHAAIGFMITIISVKRWRMTYPLVIVASSLLYVFMIFSIKLYVIDSLGHNYYAAFDLTSAIKIVAIDCLIMIFVFVNHQPARAALKESTKRLRDLMIRTKRKHERLFKLG